MGFTGWGIILFIPQTHTDTQIHPVLVTLHIHQVTKLGSKNQQLRDVLREVKVELILRYA